MKILKTRYLTVGLLGLSIAVNAGSGTIMAQDNGDLRTHTLYRPVALPSEPLPLLIWGNGGCSDYGLSHDKFLRDIASHGYIVIALGYAWRQPPRNDPANQDKDATDIAQMSQAMTAPQTRSMNCMDISTSAALLLPVTVAAACRPSRFLLIPASRHR